jgi:hypothetical protein
MNEVTTTYNNSLFQETADSLIQRTSLDTRQALFYEMRHNGLRRKKLPFPGAADLHYPLSDSFIEKHKPFYYQLLFSQDLLAMFTSLDMDEQVDASGSAHWFDYRMKQFSNLETEILVVIDFMLMFGRSICKTVWDSKRKRVKFGGIDPAFFVVPSYTEDLETADFMTEIKQMSVSQYKRLGDKWNQDPAYVKSITGPTNYLDQKLIIKNRREGINVPLADNQIIIWESYEPTSDGGWNAHWYSPAKPKEQARASQKLSKPYKKPPYRSFVTEIKDKGWYSPRGIPEICAMFEAYLTKMLNESADYSTFVNRPIYTSDNSIANMQNYKLTPGQYVPGGLRKVDQSGPAIPFEQQEANIRMIAEYRVAMPDAGFGNQDAKSDNPTATQVNAITNLMGQTIDLRARIFKKDLGGMYQDAWDLESYYSRDSLEYFQKKEMKKLDPKFLDHHYRLEPTGSVDNMNRSLVMQKAVARRNMFINVPWIDQKELDKSVLEADDPRLVDRLFVNPNEISQDQMEEQADELSNMKLGFPVQLSAEDDDFIHLMTVIQFIQSRMAKEEILEPQFAQLILMHGQAHQQRLMESPEGKKKLQGLDEGVLGAAIGYLSAMSKRGQPQLPEMGAEAPAAPVAPAPQPMAPTQPNPQEVAAV